MKKIALFLIIFNLLFFSCQFNIFQQDLSAILQDFSSLETEQQILQGIALLQSAETQEEKEEIRDTLITSYNDLYNEPLDYNSTVADETQIQYAELVANSIIQTQIGESALDVNNISNFNLETLMTTDLLQACEDATFYYSIVADNEQDNIEVQIINAVLAVGSAINQVIVGDDIETALTNLEGQSTPEINEAKGSLENIYSSSNTSEEIKSMIVSLYSAIDNEDLNGNGIPDNLEGV